MTERMESVKEDARPECKMCDGDGWRWGWSKRKLVMLRCPCVDERRALSGQTEKQGGESDG